MIRLERAWVTHAIVALSISFGSKAVLGSLARHSQLSKYEVVGICNVLKSKHLTDTEPLQLGMFVADVGRAAALQARKGISAAMHLNKSPGAAL
jgi:hypothetical protein